MFYRTIIFMCLLGFFLADKSQNSETEITFNIQVGKSLKGKPTVACDHKYEKDTEKLNKYTVLEGQTFKIITKHSSFINVMTCTDTNGKRFETLEKLSKTSKGKKSTGRFQANNLSGTIWNCTILTNRDINSFEPKITYTDKSTYAASYCFMKIHVRQKEPPQSILVNNMLVPAVRTDLSNTEVDFTAEYRYAVGDIVSVTCANFDTSKAAPLTMEYAMADALSDKYNSSRVSSDTWIGFSTTLRPEHDNTYMICTNKEPTDYTKVKVTFVKLTALNFVSIKIDGMTMRPILTHAVNNLYALEYKYISNRVINVECEVNQTDMELAVSDYQLTRVEGYTRNDTVIGKVSKLSFHTKETTKLWCSSYYFNGTNTERTAISFSAGDIFDGKLLVMNIPSNGIVMELHNEYKLEVIYYAFEDGDTLNLSCSIPSLPKHGPVLYVQFKGNTETDSKTVFKALKLTDEMDNTDTACYIKELSDSSPPSVEDKILKEIRVIFRTKGSIYPPTTTTTTISPLLLPPAVGSSSANTSDSNDENGTSEFDITKILIMAAGVAVCIIIICVSVVIIKLRKKNRAQGADNNYRNLTTPSEASIPPYPPQWEPNYAVPLDRRTDDVTYSEPCQPALYSVPTPKNQRNKKQGPDPTYAVLKLPNAQKNQFKETEDPNYSEVYANRKEQCYAQVLPKNMRNKDQEGPYSNVNEPSYANSEPMYCEPNQMARAGQYANVNNTTYINTNNERDYVEPTYCEPQKRK